MRHHCLIIILGLIVVFPSDIQSRNVLINEDKIWVYEGHAAGSTLFEFKMKFNGDTILDGRTYSVLKTYDCIERNFLGPGVSNDVKHENGGITFLLREENGRVYVHSPIEDVTDYYWESEDIEALLYDFNVTEGDVMKVINNVGYLSDGIVSKISTVNICDEDYKSYLISLYDSDEGAVVDFNVIDGIGNVTCGSVPLYIIDSYTGNSLYSFPPLFVKHDLVKVTDASGNVICEKLGGLWPWENSSLEFLCRDEFFLYDGEAITLSDSDIFLFDLSGEEISKGHGRITVSGLMPGMYIARSGHKTLKIIVR